MEAAGGEGSPGGALLEPWGVEPSARSGMGALVDQGGVAFRVWAPFAAAVSVAGDFNGWSPDAHPLASEGDGCWSADVAAATVGSHYKFAIRNGEQILWRNDPYARDVTNSAGVSIVCADTFDWGSHPYAMPAWDELVVYELHAGTFNATRGEGPGGFDSVAARLDYLRELGINAIELMPAMEYAGDFSWGYNPAHIFAIEEAYGGPDALKRLVRACHERGIAVLLDVVYNHLGPSDLDLWQFDGWSADGGGGIYFYNDWRAATPWGHTRPDYGREQVQRFLADNARMWLEEFRFDGLRWDATAYIRNVHGGDDPVADLPDGWRLMQAITRHTDAHQPWKLHIAEDLRGNGWLTKTVDAGGAGFGTQWDGDFVHPVRACLIAGDDAARHMAELARAVGGGGRALRRVIYTESHDEVANGKARLPEEIAPGDAGAWHARKRSLLGAALALTAPGIPMLFQGQEILEDAWFHDQDPVDWSREETYAGVWRCYRDLVGLRRDLAGVTGGLRGDHVNVHHVNDDDKVVAYHRWRDGGPRDDVVVTVNASARAFDRYRVGVPRGGRWRVRFNGDARAYGDDFGDHRCEDATADGPPHEGMPTSVEIGLGPYTAVICSQDE